eukprot:TRINITY_DN4775_c0_g1_i1.p1 TRINITY_DN4775_c0_g1~~TRINITY_DN4775_c0_g1_i1.p1  ORF type:complete len:414 (-),score=88.71 TRINITY_DN4775_c0_g1_i1:13-1218(-)
METRPKREYITSVAINFLKMYYTMMMKNPSMLFDTFYSERDSICSRGSVIDHDDIMTSSSKSRINEMLIRFHKAPSNIRIMCADWQMSSPHGILIHTFGEVTDITTRQTNTFYQTVLLYSRSKPRYYIRNDTLRFVNGPVNVSQSIQQQPIMEKAESDISAVKDVEPQTVTESEEDVERRDLDLNMGNIDWTDLSDDDDNFPEPESDNGKRTILHRESDYQEERQTKHTGNRWQQTTKKQKSEKTNQNGHNQPPKRREQNEDKSKRKRTVWNSGKPFQREYKSTPKSWDKRDRDQDQTTSERSKVFYDDSCALYVSNLPFGCTKEDIEISFEEIGYADSISNITLIDNRNFGFVNMVSNEEAKAIVAHSSTDPIFISGQAVNIQLKEKKKSRMNNHRDKNY